MDIRERAANRREHPDSGRRVTPRRVTLADVAARAGVSASTASLAFSGAGPVAAATRERVLSAAAALGYAGPDPLGRSLRQRRSGVVGVVVGGRLWNAFRDPVTIALLDGMAEELAGLGSGLLLLPAGRPADPKPDATAGPEPVVDRLAHVPVDVLVFATCGADDDPLVDRAQARGIPILGVEGPFRPGVVTVDLEQRPGARAAARHVAELGHTRVAVVTLPLRGDGRRGPVDADRRGAATFAVSRARLAGVADVHHLTPGLIWEAAANSVEEGERAGAALLGAGAVTAVIAQSDLLAIGVIRAAQRAGRRVPDQLSVIGFDGIDTSGWLPEAALTTMAQPMTRKGREAGRMVAALLAGRRPADVTLPVALRPGTTTGPAVMGSEAFVA